MNSSRSIFFICLIATSLAVKGQPSFDHKHFFTEESILSVTLSTDLTSLLRKKIKDDSLTATFICKLPEGSAISEDVGITLRGNMRRTICNIPPIKLHFRKSASSVMYPLKTLKLVNSCRGNIAFEELLLKEYLIYKMYNLLTEKSFRVRLLKITYEDSKARKKPFTTYGFLVEDVDIMAKRNLCKELSNININTASCNRKQMTMVDIFQYMIGNTDWSIPNKHNIKLIISKEDSLAKPYVVPYDFDYAGLVNADYAVPDPNLGLENVVQRLYRGFPRTITELQEVLQVYNQQKDNIYKLVNDLEPLNNRAKREVINYLDDFYTAINNPTRVQYEFINNARF